METSEVCVIGAGISGMSAIKHCLEYGVTVIGYELRSELGGLWTGTDLNLEQEDDNGRQYSAAYDSVLLNTSRFTSALSDYPLTEQQIWAQKDMKDRFPTGKEFFRYLKDYARHFRLNQHIQFRTEVVHVAKRNVNTDRPWEVTYRKIGEEGSERKSYHRHVIIGSGRFRKPFIPEFPGLKDTPIQWNHCFNVRNTRDMYAGKRVLVVGGSFSGGDMVEAALKAGASKVIWAMSRNPDLKSLIMIQRYPYNSYLAWDEWSTLFGMRHYPTSKAVKNLYGLMDFAHRRDNNKAPIDLDIDRFQILHTDILRQAQKEGRLDMVLGTAEKFSEDSNVVSLTTGDKVTVDVCTFATGCHFSYPFLGDDTLGRGGLADLDLHRYVIATNPHAWGLHFLYTMTFLGSAILPAEIMGRWVVHKIANGQLNTEEQRRELASKTDLNKRCFEKFHRVMHTDLMEPMSYEIGCHPERVLRQAFFSLSPWKRRVWLAVAFGPFVAQHYRLQGPHATPESVEGPLVSMAKVIFGFRYNTIVWGVDLLHLGAMAAVAVPLYRYLRHGETPSLDTLSQSFEFLIGKLKLW